MLSSPTSPLNSVVIPNRAESLVRNLLFSRNLHDPRVPHPSRTLQRAGFHGPIPLRIWGTPQPGRARLKSCRRPLKKNGTEPRGAAKECSPQPALSKAEGAQAVGKGAKRNQPRRGGRNFGAPSASASRSTISRVIRGFSIFMFPSFAAVPLYSCALGTALFA